ncbi:MAG TPA: hypothetical protein VF120_07290 [Ktedonobacterales bacterium]
MSTNTTSGADTPNPVTSSAVDGALGGDAGHQEEGVPFARQPADATDPRVGDEATDGEALPLALDAEEAPASAEGQAGMSLGAELQAEEPDELTSADHVEPQSLEPHNLEPHEVAQQRAEAAPAEWDVAQPVTMAEPVEPEIWADEDQLTDPVYSPSPSANAAPPVVPWAQTSISPDYVPPATPYVAPHASQTGVAPYEQALQPAAGYPSRFAPPVYPLPAYPLPARRRLRLSLLGVVVALILAALVVLALARGLFSATARTTAGPLYSNAMTSSSTDWPDDKECYFKSDGYHIVNASNCYYSGAQYQDATVTVTAKLLSDAQKGDAQGAYGIAFRRPGPDNFYIFLVNVSGDWFTVKDNTLLQKAQFNSAIKTGVGASNTLSVRMHGGVFTFFANGTQLGSLTDDTYTTGAVGLAGDTNLDVVYRNFAVTRPS